MTNIRKLSEVRKDAEVGAISEAIFRTGSQARAAIALGISYAQLRKIIKKHDIKLTVNELTANIRKQQKLNLLTSDQHT
jgi:molybdenum-dependent DNA-binding transcriptional regulator ModE